MKPDPVNDQGFTKTYRIVYQLLCEFRDQGIGGKIVMLFEEPKDGQMSVRITSLQPNTFTETFAANTDKSDNSETL